MRVGYSRISDQQQSTSDPLATAERELKRAGAEQVLVEVGSGTSDEQRPKFRQLREWILDGKVTEVICPSQDRLGRNLDLVLQFVQLCHLQKVKLTDLNGRELEVQTADGRLMTTIVGALDQHRSQLYGEKVRRAMESAKEQGLPVRSKLPFGFRKIRNEAGRFIAVEVDPVTGPLARQRVDWFLKDHLSIAALTRRIVEEHPDHTMSMRQLARWIESPMLTGRYCWHQNSAKRTTVVATTPAFEGLITDAEHQAILTRMQQARTNKARRGRQQRMFSGLCRCNDCGEVLMYRIIRTDLQYLRCSNQLCKRRSKAIRLDKVFAVLQYAINLHALTLVPLLNQPKSDPPEVFKLQAEINQLRAISGTEAVIQAKEQEIAKLRSLDDAAPARLIVGALRSQSFWLQEDAAINNQLHGMVDRVLVDLGERVKEAKVVEVRCRTKPASAPLPPDQDNILIPVTADQIRLTLHQQELVQQTLEGFGCG